MYPILYSHCKHKGYYDKANSCNYNNQYFRKPFHCLNLICNCLVFGFIDADKVILPLDRCYLLYLLLMLQLICEILMIAVLVFFVSPMLGQFIVGLVEAALKNMGTVIVMPISLKTTALQFLLETLIIVLAVVTAALPVVRMKPKDILSKMS